jgi:hypothetical protein
LQAFVLPSEVVAIERLEPAPELEPEFLRLEKAEAEQKPERPEEMERNPLELEWEETLSEPVSELEWFMNNCYISSENLRELSQHYSGLNCYLLLT